MSLPQAQAPLTHRGIPLERDLRVLALGSFANRFGAGAVMTTSALYFTRQVGFSAAEVALALSVAAIVGIVVQVPGLQDPQQLRALLGRTARLEFKMVDEAGSRDQAALAQNRAPIGSQVLSYAEGGPGARIAVERRAITSPTTT